MITKEEALEYELGRMSNFQILLSCIPFSHYLLEYRIKRRYKRYRDFVNQLHSKHRTI